MEEQKQAIVKALEDAGEPVRPGDVAAATGIDKAQVSKLMKKLKAEGLAHSPKRCFWAAGAGE
jgi:Mn-dependent DtxR family transcriptional regulator